MAVITKPNGAIVVSLPEYQLEQQTDPLTGIAWSTIASAQQWETLNLPVFQASFNLQMQPPVIVPVAPDPRLWWVDVGPFKDRLGMDALAIAASTNDACKAVIEMLNGRIYVDLKGQSTLNLINLLIATNQPSANPIFSGSGPLTAAKKALLINTPTLESERHIKGL